MNAYWIEYLHSLSRPVIEDGKRKIYTTNFRVIHPICLWDGDVISAGDGCLNVRTSGPKVPSKLESGDYVDCIYIGNLSKSDIEKREEKEISTCIAKEYFRNDPTKPQEENQCEHIIRNCYVNEERGNMLRHISHKACPGNFCHIVEKITEEHKWKAATPSTLEEIRQLIIAECSSLVQHPLKGNLKIVNEGRDIYFDMDDEFFLSLETIV